MIRYLASLARRTSYPPEYGLSALGLSDNRDISILVLGNESEGYWYDTWGGFNDVPTGSDAELYFGQYLQRVTTEAALIGTEYSFLVSGDNIFFNTPIPPYLFGTEATEFDSVDLYATAPRDPRNQSDITYPDDLGRLNKAPVLLEVPAVKNKLSDPVSGTTLATQFDFTLINNDGRFDDTDENNFINTPSRVWRADVDMPALSDFGVIRYGLVDNVRVTGDSFRVRVSDFFRTLTDPATNKFDSTDYPSAPNATIDKDIPIGWGELLNVPLFEIDTGEYIALDPDYITDVTTVYDGDGASISFTFDSATGVISATDAETADVTGSTDNDIGTIITTEIAAKANIPYAEGVWDVTETDTYIAIAPHVNLYYQGGDVKSLVERCLKNDSAFFITKNDGRLTLRRWAKTYTTHEIPSWSIMGIPEKSNEEGKRYYISSAAIQYARDISEDTYTLEYFDGSRRLEIAENYRRQRQGTFETELYDSGEIADFATRLLDRFGTIAEIIDIDVGQSTAMVNLLDTVTLDVTINGRRMSNRTTWIVRGVDPGQDSLTLESVGT